MSYLLQTSWSTPVSRYWVWNLEILYLSTAPALKRYEQWFISWPKPNPHPQDSRWTLLSNSMTYKMSQPVSFRAGGAHFKYKWVIFFTCVMKWLGLVMPRLHADENCSFDLQIRSISVLCGCAAPWSYIREFKWFMRFEGGTVGVHWYTSFSSAQSRFIWCGPKVEGEILMVASRIFCFFYI